MIVVPNRLGGVRLAAHCSAVVRGPRALQAPRSPCRHRAYSFVFLTGTERKLLYAILCYDSEAVVGSWTKAEDDALMGRLMNVQKKVAAQGKLGPVARLMPTTAATTLRKGRETIVLDGPFAETKKQLLGFYIVDRESLEEAIAFARELAAAATHGSGAYEIRPVFFYEPGVGVR
jgi:hypothetical protein